MSYFNLDCYEAEDLRNLVRYNKGFDGITKVKLNIIDKFINKKHKYKYGRICIFGIFIAMGVFIPFWIIGIILLNIVFKNVNMCEFLSFLICIGIGLLLQYVYDRSCDKIDYNYLIDKNAQINIFELLEKNNKRRE